MIDKQLDALYSAARSVAVGRDASARLHRVYVFCQTGVSGQFGDDPSCSVDLDFYVPSEQSLLVLSTDFIRRVPDIGAVLATKLRVAKQKSSVDADQARVFTTLPWAIDPGWALDVPNVWNLGAPWPEGSTIGIFATAGTPWGWEYWVGESAIGGAFKHSTQVASRIEPEGALKGARTHAILVNTKP